MFIDGAEERLRLIHLHFLLYSGLLPNMEILRTRQLRSGFTEKKENFIYLLPRVSED